MSSTLGEKLRQARRERGISISEVAEQTRISPLYLEAIDVDNYKTLPGGIFNKGFVRSYAKYVGVDEQEALQDYSRLVAQNEEKEEEKFKSYRPEVLTDDRSASSMVPTVIFAVVILALMTAGILFLVNYIQNQQSQPPVAANTGTAVPSNVNANTPPATPVVQGPTMGAAKIEFKTSGDDISLSSVADGAKSVALVTAGKPAVFEPKEQLKLTYAAARAQLAQLSINGKPIALPSSPPNPKRAIIELDINKENIAGYWQSGAITFGGEAPLAESTPSATQPVTRAVVPKPASTPKPIAANTTNPSPKPAPTVIIVGRPAGNAKPPVN